MEISFNGAEIRRIKKPADVALALRHLRSKPSPTEVAAAANQIKKHIDPESPEITLEAARHFIEGNQPMTTDNGLSIGVDDTIAEYPRAIQLKVGDSAPPALRANLEGLRHDIS